MKKKIFFGLFLLPWMSFGQNYTSYLTGNNTDLVTAPAGGICLMGGATEDDNAMKWFLQRANGGDVLVLRTTGSDGYNAYFYSDLGITVNSVETIVCNNALASNESYLLDKIGKAEAIWFAGGDQWTYISYWRNSSVSTAIQQAISQRNIVIGGTSAGMAIQGEFYFSAQNGTVTSAAALANPFNNQMTVDNAPFIPNAFLQNTITDTHFDNPDRKGRLVTFLARIHADHGVFANAIACDEYTAVCIDTAGIAHVFGGHPNYDDNAYFIQSNCALTNTAPENCTSGNPLQWNLGGEAIKAYQIKGDATGNRTFDLNTWQTGTGGTWLNWSVNNGTFLEQAGTAMNCGSLSFEEFNAQGTINLFPNPVKAVFQIELSNTWNEIVEIQLFNQLGQLCQVTPTYNNHLYTFDINQLETGVYFLSVTVNNGEKHVKKLIKN